MKFDNYQIRLNVKSCCLYEQIFGKNFLKLSDAEDMFELMYCIVVTNNPTLLMTYEVFKTFASDVKVSKWLEKEYGRIMSFNSQIKTTEIKTDTENKEVDEDVEELTITDVASTLIIRYGLDPHYVMYEMSLWEIQPYLTAADVQKKADLVEKRFWTYLTIAPHIDGKKIKKPEDLVPFEWEKKVSNKKMDLGVTHDAAVNFLMRRRKTEEDG